MTKQKSTNWLQPFIKKEKTTQDALALEINVSSKTIQRWGNYETLKNILFDKLATALQTNEQVLKNAHRKGLDRHHAMQKPINKKFITHALAEVESIGLTANILTKLELKTTEDAVDEIAEWIQKGNMLPFMDNFNQLITSAVEAVEPERIGELDLIEKFIRNIALATSLSYDKEKFNDNTIFDISGVTKPWPLRLLIDALKNRTMTGTTAVSSTELKTAGCVKIEETKEDEVWQRIHEIIVTLVGELFLKEDTVPELIETEEHSLLENKEEYSTFRTYCIDRLNEVIDQENHTESYVFLYSLQQESREVREKLIELLPRINIFICGNDPQATTILRVEEKRLESWMARGLFAIKNRREQIQLYEPKDKRSDANTAEDSSKQTTGDDDLSLESLEIIQSLKEILTKTDESKPEYQQLRVDVQTLIDSLNKKEEPSEDQKDWLKGSIENLKQNVGVKEATGVVTLIEKVIGLFA
jgi:hypothetical protein